MSSHADTALEAYVEAAREKDPDTRTRLLAACWADEGRLVVHGGRTLRGRDEVRAMFDRFAGDVGIARVRVLERDVRGSTFTLRYVTERTDGSTAEALDVGEVDEAGRISLLFVVPLPSSPSGAR